METREKPKGYILFSSDQSFDVAGTTIHLSKYLDTLIRLLPGYSDTNLCKFESVPDLEHLVAKTEHIKGIHKDSVDFISITRDEEINSDLYYQFITNTILEGDKDKSRASKNLSYLYLDSEESESFLDEHNHLNVKLLLEGNEVESPFYISASPGKTRVDDDNWPRIGSRDLKDTLTNIAKYLLRLGQELKLIPANQVKSYTKSVMSNVIDTVIDFTNTGKSLDGIDPSKKLSAERRRYRDQLLTKLDSIIESTGIIVDNNIVMSLL